MGFIPKIPILKTLNKHFHWKVNNERTKTYLQQRSRPDDSAGLVSRSGRPPSPPSQRRWCSAWTPAWRPGQGLRSSLQHTCGPRFKNKLKNLAFLEIQEYWLETTYFYFCFRSSPIQTWKRSVLAEPKEKGITHARKHRRDMHME